MNMGMAFPRFDDSLAIFVHTLIGVLGRGEVQDGWVLRDATGRLTFISRSVISPAKCKAAEKALSNRVRTYCHEGMVVLNIDQPGISSIKDRARGYKETLSTEDGDIVINILEQRIVGQDWLTAPAPSLSVTPPRYVFASIKGGVGRSTALAVVAADMAHQGRKVLVVDMDLEAPGIGAMLLNGEELPRFGLLDAYVEIGLGGIDREFMLDMVAASPFGKGRGLIDVVPAVGSLGQNHPANVLAKIARAYLENPSESGETLGFQGHTQQLVVELASLKHYDAVLIDARAGLNESTAAAILGLGATVLLFGEDTPQTFAGYRYLLAHLARFPRIPEDDWLLRLRMIHAKASADAGRQQAFRDSAHAIFQEFLYLDEPLVEDDAHKPKLDDMPLTMPEFSLDDPEAPHFAWPVLRDSNYYEFDPLGSASQLTSALYERTYQALLDGISLAREFDDLAESQP